MPPVFSPVWKTISSRRLVICPLPNLSAGFPALLRVIEDKGFLEVASRTRQQLSNIMRYAV